MSESQWNYKVVKSQRGEGGKWFNHAAAMTFQIVDAAIAFAEGLAKSQVGIPGTRVLVISRRKFEGRLGKTNVIAEIKIYRQSYKIINNISPP